MAKYQSFLSRIGSNRDRAALRGIFSQFLTDDDPPALKDLVLASIVLSGAETTQITISGACTTAISISSAFTTGISISGDGTTAFAVTSGFSGVNAISLAGTGSTAGINISGNHTTAITIGAQTTAGVAITGATATGISITGSCSTAALQMGVSGTPAGDFIWYGTTALYKVLFDADGDTNGAVYFGANTKGLLVSLFGDTTGCGVFWDPSTDTNGTLSIGASGGSKGNDLVAYGTTNGNYMKWDQSANSLLLVGTSTVLNIAGTTASTTSATGALICAGGVGVGGDTFLGGKLTVGVDDTGYDVKFFGATASCYMLYDESEDALNLVQTNAATTGTERSFVLTQTHTGVGASAEALSVSLATETVGGTYQNAIYGKIDYGTTGAVTGLAGVICGELSMPAGAIAGSVGTYSCFEAEIDCPTGHVTDVPINVFSINAWGGAVGKFDDNGYLFDLTGVSSDAGHIWYDHQKAAPAVEEFIRVKTPGGIRYLALYDANT